MNSFSTFDHWNPDLYDRKHSFVSQFGTNLIELLDPKRGEKMLDLGCGTGDLTKKLATLGADVVGIDASEKMIEQAKNKYPDIQFLVKDILKLDFDREFHAVFSNAVLHWIKQPKEALSCIYKSLQTGGRFVAEFGGKGNVQTITDTIITELKNEGIENPMEQFPWYYPSIGEYTALMEKVGFRVTFAHLFVRPTPITGEDGLKNWLKMFASHFFENLDPEKQQRVIEKIEQQLKEKLFHNGQWVLDYKRLRVIGWKN